MQALYFADPIKIIIVMVGLPARGKSYISKKIVRFLTWLGYKCEVFNIGNYRRTYMKERGLPMEVSYFDNQNQLFQIQRQQIAAMALHDLVDFINGGGNIAILDGTNSTKQRRKKLKDHIAEHIKDKYFFFCIESVCEDENIIQTNITKVKVYSADYEGKSPDFATEDFYKRINLYQKYYTTMSKDEQIPFLKTINIGQDFMIHQIFGYLPEKIVTYVMNLTISPERHIYLLRHGQTEFNRQDRIGGDSELSQSGVAFSKSLKNFFLEQQIPNKDKVRILTSSLKRTHQTARQIQINNFDFIQLKVLDQINAGICETLSYHEIQERFPQIAKAREQDKLRFRYPSGESYLDLISRLESVIQWIERQKYPVIVVSHQAVLRCIYAYFFQTNDIQIPFINIELHAVVKLIPETYFFSEKIYYLDLELKTVAKVVEKQKRKSIDISVLRNYKRKAIKRVQSYNVIRQ